MRNKGKRFQIQKHLCTRLKSLLPTRDRSHRAFYMFRRSGGATTLVIAGVVIPTIIFLFCLSIDITKAVSTNTSIQQFIDSVVIEASRKLPYATLAKSATERALANSLKEFEVKVSADTIDVTTTIPILISFANFFGLDIALPFTVRSMAQREPLDIMLAVDMNSSLAPPLYQIWKDETLTAQFFDDPAVTSLTPFPPKMLSQRCFNRKVMPIKKVALLLTDYFAASRIDGLGISFFPIEHDGNSGLEIVQDSLTHELRSVKPIFYEGEISKDRWCAAAAEREQSNPSVLLPPVDGELSSPYGNDIEGMKFLPPDYVFDASMQYALRARELIWGHAVTENTDVEPVKVIRETLRHLTSLRLVGQRGSLAVNARRVAIILAGSVPDAERFNSFISALRFINRATQDDRGPIQVIYIALQSPNGTADYVRSIFKDLNSQQENIKLSLIVDENWSDIVDQIVSIIDRKILLAR